MIYPLLVTALSPLLLMQGVYVRIVTPRLPEASGERVGQLGSGPPLRLLILGDSAAAGVGVSQQSQALSGQLTARLANKYQLSWQLWAKNGFKSQDILALLASNPAEPIDVVILSIGVNDVTSGVSLKKWAAQQQQIIALLLGKYSVQHIVFTALPPMHLFPALPQPLRWVFGLRAKQFNALLQSKLASSSHCTFLEFKTPLKAEYMAIDGFHPNDKTYQLWAQEATQAIQQA